MGAALFELSPPLVVASVFAVSLFLFAAASSGRLGSPKLVSDAHETVIVFLSATAFSRHDSSKLSSHIVHPVSSHFAYPVSLPLDVPVFSRVDPPKLAGNGTP